MSGTDKIAQEHMIKEYASNSKKLYEHIENCNECRAKLAEILGHTYSQQ